MKIPELLAPAGSFDKLVTALHYGADAVYLGISAFSLRAKTDNFTDKTLKEAVALCRHSGKRVYVTVNVFAHNSDIDALKKHVELLRETEPDGVIVSDPGVFDCFSEHAPGLSLHVSTQANTTNYRSAKFWERLGARRLVLSRELTLEEIRRIRDHVSLELECFVHGSLCISYSGRCYMSSFLANRSANLGRCTNSCRWKYALVEEKRPGQYLPVYEDDRGTYVMSSRDLCLIEHLDKLADAGVDSFKIEGRMKGVNYLAGVVKSYREAVDALAVNPYMVKESWLGELAATSNRGFTTGMYLGKQPDGDYNHDEEEIYRTGRTLVGIVKAIDGTRGKVLLRDTLRIGDTLEPLTHGCERTSFCVTEMRDLDGNHIDTGKAAQNNEEMIVINLPAGVRVNDLLRRGNNS
ncbi:MAG: U32 family peptidase [Nitrospirae bacterium]|nr:U32 family peptidase [Nitrospirota bacterium]